MKLKVSDLSRPFCQFRFRQFRHVVWALASLLVLGMALRQVPICEGDGYEYALTLEAFYRHFSPDIRLGDVDRLIGLIEKFPSQVYSLKPLQEMSAAMQSGQSEVLLGIFRTDNGQYFGYHFGFYSLLNLPVKAALAVLQLNELKAFQLTNALIMVATMGYLCVFSILEIQTRNILLMFYLLGCSIFYLFWPHPEILAAALALIASCALCEKRFYLAVLAASLCALQNPSSLFFAALIILALFLYKRRVILSKRPDGKSLKLLAISVLTSLLSFVPYAFYYYHYQVPNLIVTKGFVDKSLIGLPRLSSTLFDLNQGLIVGFPGILAGITALLGYRLLTTARQPSGNFLNLSDWLLLAFFLVIAPTLGQTNWNHGQNILSRYAVWSGMLLATWLAYNCQTLGRRWKRGLLAAIILLQLPAYNMFFRQPQAGKYLRMKPLAERLLEHFPAMYNPDPEIFAERVKGRERFGETVAPSHLDAPFAYRDRSGALTKILIHQSSSQQTEALICGPQGRLLADAGPSFQQQLSTARFDPRQWAYLQGSYGCSVPMQIDFSEQGNFYHFQQGGWAYPTASGTPMQSDRARLTIPLREAAAKALSVSAKLQATEPMTLSASANGNILATWRISAGASQATVTIPASLLANHSTLMLSFEAKPQVEMISQTISTLDTEAQVIFKQILVEPQ
jgi:hypothetical protein